MNNALHFKYRPQTFDELAGNESAIDMIISILDREDFNAIPRTWLLTGESGTGKTTVARIMKTELKCSNADFHEFNASNTRGIDTIREISSIARLAPMDSDCKIFLLDECHMLTPQAMQSALKMLEDTPSNTFFFLATTNPEKLLKAIKTRCTLIKMKTLSYKVIVKYLAEITHKEGIEGYPTNILTAIAKASQGSCREAVKILDQVIDIEEDDKALSAIESSLGDESSIADLCKALIKGSEWKVINTILDELEMEPEAARHVILSWFSKTLSNGDERVADMMEMFLDNFYDSGKAGLKLSCFHACNL